MLAPPRAMLSPDLKRARRLALIVPAVLLGGALLSQYVGGLYPCEMCLWQRWPHRIALLLAAAAILLPPAPQRVRLLTLLAAAAIAVSGAIGAFHAGVEYGWWEGITNCTSTATTLQDIMSVPLVRCDQMQWSLLGISLAGFNAILSLGGAALITSLALRKARR